MPCSQAQREGEMPRCGQGASAIENLGHFAPKIAGIDDHAILGHFIGSLNQLNPFPYGKNTVFDSIVGRDSHLKRIRRVVS